MKDDIVIVSAARTPVGAFNGVFANLPAHELGKVAIKAALERAGIEGAQVSEVILGQILSAGQGQNPARQASIAAGIPVEMARSGRSTFCCGAGGAHMWMEERAGQINEARVHEAAATGADTLAVACPFCTVMLDDGVRSMGKQLRVVDVSTLLVESIEN